MHFRPLIYAQTRHEHCSNTTMNADSINAFFSEKAFITQSSKRLIGNDLSILSVYTNEETNPWVQIHMDTVYAVRCVTLVSGIVSPG